MPLRRGLTRVELLVSVVIVALLAGLIVSAIAHLRASADLMTCRNNLRQLALTVHNCQEINGRLTPLADQGDGAPTGRGLPSVFAMLLPYVEATAFAFSPDRPPDHYYAHSSVTFPYKNKDGTVGNYNGGVANQAWRIFLDPSDSSGDRLRDVPMTLPDGATGYYATGSYAANGLLPWGKRRSGSFPGHLANTIIFGERPQVCRSTNGETVYNLWGLGIYSPHMPAFAALTPVDPPGLLSTEQIAPVEPIPAIDESIRVRIGRRDAPPEPADFATPIQIVQSRRPCDPRLPGTPHREGMQVLMMDGSVRIFTKDTDPAVFWSACVPARPADER